jgi:hypothetical protein
MRWSSLVGALLTFSPSAALACSVCGTLPERSQTAYVSMTALLTFLPLGVLGALVYLAVRRIRAAEVASSALVPPTPIEQSAANGRTEPQAISPR